MARVAGEPKITITRSRLINTRGGAAAEEAFFSDLKPGSTVALFYADDPDVWHESLITWVGCGRKRPVAMVTPDGDHYVEWLSSREAGPRRIAACKNTGECIAVPPGQFYRFSGYPRGDDLLMFSDKGAPS